MTDLPPAAYQPPSHEELARRTRHIHRKNFWRGIRYRTYAAAMRPLCLPRRHAHWQRDTLLTALAGGRSRRCTWCNRLVLKPEFRVDAGWVRTVRGWVWSRG